jgi:hypothetical protein
VGIILSARARLKQNPAPPVANQKAIFFCLRKKTKNILSDDYFKNSIRKI